MTDRGAVVAGGLADGLVGEETLHAAHGVAFGGLTAVVSLTVGLVLALVSGWFLVTRLGMPDGYPDPVCPGNVPPRWPGFIPA
ncbi:hypothetical protein [Streptomyces bottropensis]|uniref:hypothetical protein n=1 Tax=Streptomyces bottropensis TaxID=42235 RepID=UPI0036CD025C